MRKFFLLAVTALMSVAFMLNSCNKQNEIPTPDEYKADISDALTKTFELIDAQDNKDLLRVLNEAIVLSQYFEPVYTVSPLVAGEKNYVAAAAQSTIDLCQIQNPAIRPLKLIKLAQAMNPFVQLYGTLTFNPDTMTWDFTENDKALEFRYPFEGKEVVWTLVFSGEQIVELYVFDQNGQQVGSDEAVFPEEMKATIVWGGETLYSLEVASDLSKSLDIIKMNLKSDAGGYIEEFVVDANSTAVAVKSNTVIKGQEVMNINLLLKGEGMTDQMKLIQLMNAENPLPLMKQMYKSVSADAEFMNEVVLKADVKDIPGLFEFIMLIGSPESNMTEEEMNQRLAELVQICFCYADTENVLATVDFQFTEDDMIVMVNFTDGTSIPFDEYFDEVFVQDLERMLEEILADLEEYMPALFEYGQMM